jgi:hypothetical protein
MTLAAQLAQLDFTTHLLCNLISQALPNEILIQTRKFQVDTCKKVCYTVGHERAFMKALSVFMLIA